MASRSAVPLSGLFCDDTSSIDLKLDTTDATVVSGT